MKAKQAEVTAAIGGEAAAEAARLRAEQEASMGGAPPPGPPLPEDVAGLVQELCALSAAENYALRLQVPRISAPPYPASPTEKLLC